MRDEKTTRRELLRHLKDAYQLLAAKDAIAYSELVRVSVESETQLASIQNGTRYYTGDEKEAEDARIRGDLAADFEREQEELDAALRHDS